MTAQYSSNAEVGTAIAQGCTTAGWVEQHSQVSWDMPILSVNNIQNVRDSADLARVAERDRDARLRAMLRGALNIPTLPTSAMTCGDSITWGFGSPDGAGYPAEVKDWLDQRNIVAAMSSLAEPDWNLGNLTAGMAAALSLNNPHVVTIHIGTNDAGGDLSTYSSRYQALLQQILAYPSVLGIVCVLIPVASGGPASYQAGARQVNADVTSVVAGMASPKVVTADCTTAHTAAWTTYPNYPTPPYGRSTALDLMHPDWAGCYRTAQKIGPAVAQFVPGYVA